MKFMGLFGVLLSFLLFIAPVVAETTVTTVQTDPLPASGTYFITNMSTDQALQPAGSTTGQNVLLYPFNKGGLQKWTITRKFDQKTHKPTNRYTIRLAGENTTLNFQPHPVADMTAIVGDDAAVYALEPVSDGVLVKSVSRNGDAMYFVSSPPMNAETHFGPSDGSDKFQWKFIPAN